MEGLLLIKSAIDNKLTDGDSLPPALGNVASIVHNNRHSARKLDEMGRSCVPLRVIAGGLRLLASIGTFVVAAPAHYILKYSGCPEEQALRAKYAAGRALDEGKRAIQECGALVAAIAIFTIAPTNGALLILPMESSPITTRVFPTA